MTTETFRRADHRPVPTSAHEAEASAVAGSLRGLSLVLFSLGHNSFSFSQKAVQRNRGAREPDVAAARGAWHAGAPTWDPTRLVFLDETGITTNLLRRYGRATRGTRVHDHTPGARWQTSTFLAALRVTGLTAPGVFDGAIDGTSFLAYIDQILVPTLRPGDIVIADNLSVHKTAGVPSRHRAG